MALQVSPFLRSGTASRADSLAIVHLKRDLQMPMILREQDEDDEGYAEGKVVNTRFGSFPHSTLIGLPWGSQVRASKVDTGSRGRRVKQVKIEEKKRKREDSGTADAPNKALKLGEDAADEDTSAPGTPATKEEKEAVQASSGFIHLLPPTPENWTSSLPHRTQVVYTPDYSYILHRIRARPGTSIIEAGAGSGSFTHASARAVYYGYPGSPEAQNKTLGKVWSFEFHEQRHQKLQKEIQDHGLEEIVEITHRDVCEDGFLVNGASPNAGAIFLDLPAPWLALPHLARSQPTTDGETKKGVKDTTPFLSALDPGAPVHICTFSPCIEQVQRTVSTMRHLGWVDISMVEVSQKRFEIRRERVGIDNGANRGLQVTPASVDEAVARLLDVENNFQTFHKNGDRATDTPKKDRSNPNSKEKILESLVDKKVYKEGRLVHRTEPEVKTHTSYLVFAVLPMQWSEEDERKAREAWPVKVRTEEDKHGEVVVMGKRASKRAERKAAKDAKQQAEKTERIVHDTPGVGDAMALKTEVAVDADVDADVDAMDIKE